MGGGRYSTNNRVNAASAAAAAQRAAALASGPAYPVVSDPVVNLPTKSVVQPAPEEFASLASPFETTADPYSSWFSETERGQRSDVTTTPDLFSPESFGMTAEELAAGAAKRDRDNAAAIASIPPEQLARLEAMDLSGIGNGIMGGSLASGGVFGNAGSVANPAVDVGVFARENQYNNITAYNPLGTAPEDMVVYDDLNSPEAKAAKSSREAELSKDLQSWSGPLKKLSKTDPAKFGQQYSALPLTGQLAYLKDDFDKGNMTEREYQDAFAEQWNASDKAGTLQFIDKYGWRMYAPDAIAQQGGQDPNGPQAWYETEGLFDGSIDRLDQFTPRVKETFDPTSIGRGLLANPVLRAAAAAMTGGVSEGVIAAGKGLTGDTLHGSDWLSIAVTGLTTTGAIKPPIEGADTIGLGQAGPTLQTGGTGLFGTTYGQTIGALGAASAGDVEGAAMSLVGGQLVKGGLDKIGLDEAALTKTGIQYDDFTAGVTKAVTEVVQGEDLDKALVSGLGKYITEGGTLGNLSLPDSPDLDIDISGIEDFVRDVVRPIGKIGTAVAHFVEDAVPVEAIKEAGKAIDDVVLQPAKEAVQSVTEPVYKAAKKAAPVVEDVVRETGSAVDDAVIQPIREVGKVIDDEVIQPAGDALSALDTAVRQALPDIDLPDIDLPDIDLPDIDLPDIDLPDIDLPDIDLNLPNFNMPSFGLGDMGMVMGLMTPQANATTNKLFENELFKFKTEVGITDREELIDIEDFLTSSFSSSFDQQQRF